VKIKLDENLPSELATDLRAFGHDTDTVVDENLGGFADPDVIAAATLEKRILFTLDKGSPIFSGIRFTPTRV
jgi:predicted nuclease of predicted toxin-antitoxin system